MTNKIKGFLVIFLLLALNSCKEKKTIITIGSGSPNAMYYPVATSLCEIFNKYNQQKNIICEAKLSKGAEFNLESVQNGKFDMGISQSNLQYDAYKGSGKFKNNSHKNLRSLFNLHNEYLTIIVKNNSNINNFSDLKGKKVNIGNIGSGSRILFKKMIKSKNWELDDFAKIYEESGSSINKILCPNNKADAAVYIVGHPNKSFDNILKTCNSKLISLSSQEIKNFIKLDSGNFYKSSIAKNNYKSHPKEINTFAVATILSVSDKINHEILYNFIQVLDKHKEELVKLQPSLKSINISSVKNPHLIAPVHEVVNEYYK